MGRTGLGFFMLGGVIDEGLPFATEGQFGIAGFGFGFPGIGLLVGMVLLLSTSSRHTLELRSPILLATNRRSKSLRIADTILLQLADKAGKAKMMRLILVHN